MTTIQEDGAALIGGRLLDRYRVDEAIARGGMSIIYRGWDERLLRPVCIKLFRDIDLAENARRAVHDHFVREAYTLSHLHHPNTLRIYDFGRLHDQWGGAPFQISELAEGGTLRELVRREGPLGSSRALALLEPIGGALIEAHGRGIIHRDIKPSNVLLCHVGSETILKLADFGIAHSSAGPADLVVLPDGPAMYSLNWAAPEQFRGDPAGPSTDVYSLALLMVFVLTGRIVFAGDDVQRLFRERSGGDAALAARLAVLQLPPALAAVVSRACRDDQAERTPDVATFFHELRNALAADASLRVSSEPGRDSCADVEGWRKPPSDDGTPVVTLNTLSHAASGARVRVVNVEAAEALSLDFGSRTARVRVRALGHGEGVHLKGLDCFLCDARGRPSSGLSVDETKSLSLVSAGREELGRLVVHMGTLEGDTRVFRLEDVTVIVPLCVADWAVTLDAGAKAPAIVLVRQGE